LPLARLRQSRPRAAAGRAGARGGARPCRLVLVRRRARDPRVRAGLDHRGQRLRGSPDGALHRRPRGAPGRAGHSRTALHHAVVGGHRPAADGAPAPHSPRRVRSRRRRPRRRAGRPPAGRAAHALLRHGGHHGQGVRDRRRRALGGPRVRGRARGSLQEGLRSARARPRHRDDRDRRGRRLRRGWIAWGS
jgi:hypothetical protein